MDREYKYENAIVRIVIPERMENLHSATETFLKKVLQEEPHFGYSNKAETVKEE